MQTIKKKSKNYGERNLKHDNWLQVQQGRWRENYKTPKNALLGSGSLWPVDQLIGYVADKVIYNHKTDNSF